MLMKEVKPLVKEEMEEVIKAIAEKYGKNGLNALRQYLRNEAGMAIHEMEEEGRILTNTERWK